MDITTLEYYDKQGKVFKNAKTQLEHSSKKIRQTIVDNTKPEFDELQKALDRYNAKVTKIMESDYIKRENKKMLLAKQDMIDSFKKAANHYFNERDKIFKNPDFSSKEKRHLDSKLYNAILNSFLTNEEREEFENMINYVSKYVNKNENHENHNKIEFKPKLYKDGEIPTHRT
jgi:hypothetical protein